MWVTQAEALAAYSTIAGGKPNVRKTMANSSLQEVAECAAEGKERKESSARVAHREKLVLLFKKRADELGIKIVVKI